MAGFTPISVMKVMIMRAMRGEFISMDVYADGLAEGLREAHPDWTVLEIEPPVRLNARIGSKAARAVNGLARYGDRFLAYPLKTLMQKADIIHVMSDHHFHVARFMRRPGQKVVATCHDLIFYRFPANIQQFAPFLKVSRTMQAFCMRSLRHCDHVITLCQENVQDLKSILGIPPEKVTVIHNAVSKDFQPVSARAREDARARLGLDDRFFILHPGTVEPRKNVDTILKAMVELKGKGVAFLKTGADFTSAQKEYIAENRLEGAIVSLGRLPSGEIPAVYGAVDALVFPSLYEGFGFPIVEAMASGLPVITSLASCLPEVAGGAALLIEPLDAGKMAEAVLTLKEDMPVRNSLIQRGLERVGPLTWRENARKVGQVYEQVLGPSR